MTRLCVYRGIDNGRTALAVEGDDLNFSYRLTSCEYDFRFTLARIVGEGEAAYKFALGLIGEELQRDTLCEDVRKLLLSLPPARDVDWPTIRGDVNVYQLITWGRLDVAVYRRLHDAGIIKLRDLDEVIDRYHRTRKTGIPGVGQATVMKAITAIFSAYLRKEYPLQDLGQVPEVVRVDDSLSLVDPA